MEHKHAVRILNDHAQAVAGQTEDSLYFKVQLRDGQEELVRGDLVSILMPSRVQEYARRCSCPIFPSHSLPSSSIEENDEDDPLLLWTSGCSFSSCASASSPSSSPAAACPAASSNSPSTTAETTHAVALSAARSISPRSSPSSSASDSSPLLGSGFMPDTNLRWAGGVWTAWVLFKWPATNEETSIGSKEVWRSLNALRDAYFQQCGRRRPEPVTRGNVTHQLTRSRNGNIFGKTLKAGRQTYYLLPFETLPPRFQICIRCALMEEVIVLRNRDSFGPATLPMTNALQASLEETSRTLNAWLSEGRLQAVDHNGVCRLAAAPQPRNAYPTIHITDGIIIPLDQAVIVAHGESYLLPAARHDEVVQEVTHLCKRKECCRRAHLHVESQEVSRSHNHCLDTSACIHDPRCLHGRPPPVVTFED